MTKRGLVRATSQQIGFRKYWAYQKLWGQNFLSETKNV